MSGSALDDRVPVALGQERTLNSSLLYRRRIDFVFQAEKRVLCDSVRQKPLSFLRSNGSTQQRESAFSPLYRLFQVLNVGYCPVATGTPGGQSIPKRGLTAVLLGR
jgi:hypothetical protein